MIDFAINHVWLVPLLPALAFAIIVLLARPWEKLSAFVAIFCMACSFAVAALAAYGVFFANYATIDNPLFYHFCDNWLNVGSSEIGGSIVQNVVVNLGVYLDPTSAMMIFMVSMVALLIQIYSLGYMRGEAGFSVFFSYLSLFAASMLLLVISSSLLQMFIAWELVGLCSYLLIGFYTHKVSAREAAKKAFVTCRIADFGLLLGLLAMQIVFGTLDLEYLPEAISTSGVGLATLTIIALLVFIGPIAKSGQFPLHVWLPDAMEGPTPVSALIHAATMVVAGVYLIGRTMFLFSEVPSIMQVVAFTGAFTALFAALIAITQREIKKILAYSTVSQLGYMMLALGVGSVSASMFHLWTHAFFKALMFLGAGSVLVALHHKADVWEMGGLRKKMPITAWTFVIGGLSIAGIFPLAGFWSKDEILAMSYDTGHYILFAMAAITAFLTAFYMWRLIFLAFFGDEKPQNSFVKESPKTMTVPLIILAVFAVIGGWIGTPWTPEGANWFNWIYFGHAHVPEANWVIMIGSTILAIAGIFLAYRLYCADKSKATAHSLANKFRALHTLSYNKFFIDEIYLWLNHKVMDGAAKLFFLFDIYIVDGIIVNGLAALFRLFGEGGRVAHTGRLQNYALVIVVGILAVMVILAFTNPTYAQFLLGGGSN